MIDANRYLRWGIVSCSLLMNSMGFSGVCEPAWKLGIMADTQDLPPLIENADTVSVKQIAAVNEGFIKHKVDVALQMGDLADLYNPPHHHGLEVRYKAAESLRKAKIPFYAIRGNHDSADVHVKLFKKLFLPKTMKFREKSLDGVWCYKNVELYFLDTAIQPQPEEMKKVVQWMDDTIAPPDGRHTFILGHRNLVTVELEGQSNMFGLGNDSSPDVQNAFFSVLNKKGIYHYYSAHLHLDRYRHVFSPDYKSYLYEQVCAVVGNNLFPIGIPFNKREKIINQIPCSAGYYIIDVDGPIAWMSYYGGETDASTDDPPKKGYNLVTHHLCSERTQVLSFDQNHQSQNCTMNEFSKQETSLTILNPCEKFSMAVAWLAQPKYQEDWQFKGPVLSVRPDFGQSHKTCLPYVISMSYDESSIPGGNKALMSGQWDLVFLTPKTGSKGKLWRPAVRETSLKPRQNKMIIGSYNPKEKYPVGTQGIDLKNKKVWAILDYYGDFCLGY